MVSVQTWQAPTWHTPASDVVAGMRDHAWRFVYDRRSHRWFVQDRHGHGLTMLDPRNALPIITTAQICKTADQTNFKTYQYIQ